MTASSFMSKSCPLTTLPSRAHAELFSFIIGEQDYLAVVLPTLNAGHHVLSVGVAD